MKTILKTLALGLFLFAAASCEKHDLFDENTITGAVGPETYWTVESSMVKAGEAMTFVGQYYSTAAEIDHAEVWYELFEQEDKLVTASLIKAFTYSVSSSVTAQKRMLQTIQSYPHSEDLWSDSLHAYVLESSFPISNTLSPVTWAQPKDLNGFDKNLNAYFGEGFAADFKAGVTAKMNPSEDERNFAAYMNVLQGLSLLNDTIITLSGDTMTYIEWITDSTYNANTASWQKDFKRIDTVWSIDQFDTLDVIIKDTFKVGKPDRYGKRDTTYFTDTTYITHPVFLYTMDVYPQIKHAIDSVWENHVSFYDLILGAEGYSVDYKREYYINAELRIYDENGTYSSSDAKKININ